MSSRYISVVFFFHSLEIPFSSMICQCIVGSHHCCTSSLASKRWAGLNIRENIQWVIETLQEAR